MGLLGDVISASQTTTIDNLNKQIPGLMQESISLNNNIITYIEETYVKYTQRPATLNTLLTKSHGLIKKSEDLKGNINDTIVSSEIREKIELHNTKLQDIDYFLKLTYHLCKINEAIIQNTKCQTEKLYEQGAMNIIEADEYIKSVPEVETIPAISKLFDHYGVKKEILIQTMNDVVESSFICKEEESGGKQIRKIIIKDSKELSSALMALSTLKDLSVLNGIIKFLLDKLLNPIVKNSTTVKTQQDKSTDCMIVIIDCEERMMHQQVFRRLYQFIEFIYCNFNHKFQNGNTISYIGEKLRKNLSELIIKECLDHTIPSTIEGLKEYSEVINDTRMLQNKLMEVGLFDKNSTSIIEHASNVDILFINKKCTAFDTAAAELMKADLHDVVEVGTPFDPNALTDASFPQCYVSKSVIKILQLLENILSLAAESSDVCAGHLLVTVKNILYKYPCNVQQYHEKLLQTIPQQVAIFYNNCNYFVYEMNDHKWTELHQNLAKTFEPNARPQFDFLRNTLATAGEDLFETFVTEQANQIKTVIKDCGLDSEKSCESLEPIVEKHVRQCLRQQELLKTVWQKILDYHTYNKTIGLLLDTLCKSLIASILNLDDLGVAACEQLADIIKLISTRGPRLFTEAKEINMYVASWQKLNELLFILSSSMVNIHDRWADGKGPLALHFAPAEIRHLIRALFQNTDKRSEILSKICDLK